MAGQDANERLVFEVGLLESMYPGQVSYQASSHELSYTTEGGKLQLRLPDGYLKDALPVVLAASIDRNDVRDVIKRVVSDNNVGEEILDSIILAFNDEIARMESTARNALQNASTPAASDDAIATVVVWLHHLLNTNKRKLALSPSEGVSGITKPGYPGVLVYSGSAKAVHEHVNELKQQNWQAFQVRLEEDEGWHFGHGVGVIEVEAMKDVVADIGEEKKQVFMEAMKIK